MSCYVRWNKGANEDWSGLTRGLPPSDNVVADILAIDAPGEDDWDLQDIMPFDVIDVQSGLRCNLSILQEAFHLYGLQVLVSAGGTFGTPMQGINTLLANMTRSWNN